MAVSVFLKAFARRGQLPISHSAYQSVFRNVNTSWNSSLLGRTFTSLGSRAFCSKPDHSDPVVQDQTKKLPESNLTKVVFKYVCENDESREASRPFKPVVRKVLEIPGGRTFFEWRRDGDGVCYYDLSDLCYSTFRRFKEAAESTTGIRVSAVYLVYPSLFKEHIRSIMDRAADVLNVDCMIYHIEKIEDPFLIGENPGSGCGLRWNLDELFAIRIWEKITSGDKHVLETIVSQLKRDGFDFTEDSEALQKIGGAVERAMTRMTNVIKLNLPVPAGEPDISTTVSWGNCAGLPILETISLPPQLCLPQ
ncbi:hypothetical protein MKW94_020248 [Papaver nudicaule]|uniref:Uncharacterized protein n=1 Tax=Papaver nudicaule TaxID=74823 RepID=A0AA41SGC8_PAPNU|nr:hypothetical protein [Papaver nudicaule]